MAWRRRKFMLDECSTELCFVYSAPAAVGYGELELLMV